MRVSKPRDDIRLERDGHGGRGDGAEFVEARQFFGGVFEEAGGSGVQNGLSYSLSDALEIC